MFARKVAARLKPNSLAHFKNLIECEVLPWLRGQQGFLHVLILAARDGREVATISFWDHEADAGRWDLSGSPAVVNSLGTLLDGPPYVKTFDQLNAAGCTSRSQRRQCCWKPPLASDANFLASAELNVLRCW
jgi:heme-degrading monooxygenase HmoA